MKKRFVCLANSYKEKGRCVAGIELDKKNNPILLERPKWIRPISDLAHGEIPNEIVENYQILDIIELETIKENPTGYQSENVTFKTDSIQKIDTFDKNKLEHFCENPKYIFLTRYPSLSKEVIQELDHSLIFIKPSTFKVIEKTYEGASHPKHRLVFEYNGFEYDFSITDPVFLAKYQHNHNLLDEIDELYLCLSVGVKFEKTEKYYKLVAGIIF